MIFKKLPQVPDAKGKVHLAQLHHHDGTQNTFWMQGMPSCCNTSQFIVFLRFSTRTPKASRCHLPPKEGRWGHTLLLQTRQKRRQHTTPTPFLQGELFWCTPFWIKGEQCEAVFLPCFLHSAQKGLGGRWGTHSTSRHWQKHLPFDVQCHHDCHGCLLDQG